MDNPNNIAVVVMNIWGLGKSGCSLRCLVMDWFAQKATSAKWVNKLRIGVPRRVFNGLSSVLLIRRENNLQRTGGRREEGATTMSMAMRSCSRDITPTPKNGKRAGRDISISVKS